MRYLGCFDVLGLFLQQPQGFDLLPAIRAARHLSRITTQHSSFREHVQPERATFNLETSTRPNVLQIISAAYAALIICDDRR